MTESINYISLATGCQHLLDGDRITLEDRALFEVVIDRGIADLPEHNIQLVINRPVGKDSKPTDGLMNYFFIKGADQENTQCVGAGLVCWDPEQSDMAWEFAKQLQENAGLFCAADLGDKPVTPWVAAIGSEDYAGLASRAKELVSITEQRLVRTVVDMPL